MSGGANFRYQADMFFLKTHQATAVHGSGARNGLAARITPPAAHDRWSLPAIGVDLLDDRPFAQIAAVSAAPVVTVAAKD